MLFVCGYRSALNHINFLSLVVFFYPQASAKRMWVEEGRTLSQNSCNNLLTLQLSGDLPVRDGVGPP